MFICNVQKYGYPVVLWMGTFWHLPDHCLKVGGGGGGGGMEWTEVSSKTPEQPAWKSTLHICILLSRWTLLLMNCFLSINTVALIQLHNWLGRWKWITVSATYHKHVWVASTVRGDHKCEPTTAASHHLHDVRGTRLQRLAQTPRSPSSALFKVGLVRAH